MIPILAKNRIKNIQSLQDYECRICFQVNPTIMQCRGPCKGIFCLKCATTICRNKYKNICPQRCSSPFRLDLIPHFQLQFNCPFNQEMCKQKIEGYYALIEHYGSCEYMTREAIEVQLRKDEFICKNGHSLSFLDIQLILQIFTEFTVETLVRECTNCREVRICRSYCKKCSSKEKHVSYCHECRPLPCSKNQCPFGHEFVKIQVNRSFECDLCSSSIFIFSNQCYHDYTCNFSLCQRCYKTLPEHCPLIPLRTNQGYSQDDRLSENMGISQEVSEASEEYDSFYPQYNYRFADESNSDQQQEDQDESMSFSDFSP